ARARAGGGRTRADTAPLLRAALRLAVTRNGRAAGSHDRRSKRRQAAGADAGRYGCAGATGARPGASRAQLAGTADCLLLSFRPFALAAHAAASAGCASGAKGVAAPIC